MISIIIPTLNEEKILEKTLKALCELNAVPYEIIVSDGGSTDKTVQIAKKFANKVVTHDGKTRQTIGIGRNAGAKIASGELLLFLDADVFIPEINDFFVKAINLFDQDKKLAGLTVFLKVLPESVTISDWLFFSMVNRSHQFFNNVLHSGTASGEFMMVRASAFNQINGFNEKLIMGEDNDLFARLSKIGATKIESGLYVMHTARRAHDVGWFKLLPLWWLNMVYNKIFKRSFSKEWKVIR
jgi:glycosyltransferase involved in cell wall biosynthesis